jgi:hypothetical protein
MIIFFEKVDFSKSKLFYLKSLNICLIIIIEYLMTKFSNQIKNGWYFFTENIVTNVIK